MSRAEVLDKLQAHKHTLTARFDVTGLAVFGSFARDQVKDKNAVDILVSFYGPATSGARTNWCGWSASRRATCLRS